MSIEVITTTINTTGVGMALTEADTLVLPAGMMILSREADAIWASGATVQIYGDVVAANAGIAVDAAGTSILIGSSGHISGGGRFGAGLSIEAVRTGVINQGVISGAYGIVLGSAATGLSRIDNSGLISGTSDAILRRMGATDTLRLVNSGEISAMPGATALDDNLTNAVEQVLNRGRIIGDMSFGLGDDLLSNRAGAFIDGAVQLGGGADVFDGRGGMVTGTVDGGSGNDRFCGNADEAETLRGGTGIDWLDFHHGGGVVLALDGSFEAGGAALGDDIGGFEAIVGSDHDDRLRGDGFANEILGRSGADWIDGAAGQDRLFGGAEDDTLAGGLGADTLTGGTGADVFLFSASANGADAIADFSPVDRIGIALSGFGSGLALGELVATAFVSRTDNRAQDADDRFIFRTTDGTLWFDADGKGGSAAVLIADLQEGAVLKAADIWVL